MECLNKCGYCHLTIYSDDFLNCLKCKQSVHTKCLLRPGTPGDLHGDVFFTFACVKCADNSKEEFIRQDLTWFMIVTLALYNLSIRSTGLGRQGFFHYRTHICNFIAKNWTFLFNPAHNIYRQRKKKWQGTVAGVLSTHKNYFNSGFETFGEPGWWKLAYNQTPKFYAKLYEQADRLQLRNDKRNNEESCSSDLSNAPSDEVTWKRRKGADVECEQAAYKIAKSSSFKGKKEEKEEEDNGCCRTRPYTGRKTEDVEIKVEISEEAKEINSVQSHLMDFLAENLSCDDLLSNDLPAGSKDFLPLISTGQEQNLLDLWNPDATNLDYEDAKFYNFTASPSNESLGRSEKYTPRIIQVTNFQQLQSNDNDLAEKYLQIKNESQSDAEEINFECSKSLFQKKPKRELPWNEETSHQLDQLCEFEDIKNFEPRLELMSEYDEKVMHRLLKEVFNIEESSNFEIPPNIRRLYRKLCIRDIKRCSPASIFDMDGFIKKSVLNNQKTKILDRYYQLISKSKFREDGAFYAQIAGNAREELFESPYTSRVLHPYIYRHSKCCPPWLRMMCELQCAVNGEMPSRSTIDFCYVRPHHISAVNGLLENLFWAGIDMSECLSYPDFSVVAVYKKLVVGCAFLVPDVGYNEAYISFMAVRPGWQRNSIASFMLYHLTQTCMGKDITLHVSANNPAICLYQKFGFKIEEVILDFYEKYLPIESTQSRHAFLLRLKR